MTSNEQLEAPFPIVDALLLTPEESQDGKTAICTNTSAAGEIWNEVDPLFRPEVPVLGSLVVNRDGAERMIINSLAHPTLRYIVLFSEEAKTFAPSSNLLLALQNGFNDKREGNRIQGGMGATPEYPNLNADILDAFRESITVLPFFMHKNPKSERVIDEYLEWLKPRVSTEVHSLLKEGNAGGKIYYDALNALLEVVAEEPKKQKDTTVLDPRDFQQLQPPVRELERSPQKGHIPVSITSQNGSIKANFLINGEPHTVKGDNDFQLAYTLTKALGEQKRELTPLQQLLIGAEIGHASLLNAGDLDIEDYIDQADVSDGEYVPLESSTKARMDKDYYYRIGIKDSMVSAMCMAHDVCEEVFDLRSDSPLAILEEIAKQDRFEDYEFDILHRLDVGAQIARAAVAARNGYSFVQDFSSVFKTNTTELPLLFSEADTFLGAHKGLLTRIYTEGITEEHADKHKGLARTAIALAVMRDAGTALEDMPMIYKQGSITTKEMRDAYKGQLLRRDHDGDYSYGERTRSFFGFDQLQKTAEVLKANRGRAAVIQRYDPVRDMGVELDPDTGKHNYTHDPCLTHDIYFVRDNKLHGFHVARAHNTVNAYPENVYGLYDAYTTPIAEDVGVTVGDEFMLSSRANILLLTEEQRTKTLLAEPAKPVEVAGTQELGPYRIGPGIGEVGANNGIAYLHEDLAIQDNAPEHPTLAKLQSIEGTDTLQKAIDYLAIKGSSHNNPVLSEYRPGVDDPQGDHLVFFQANVFGGKVHATAVFMNRHLNQLPHDTELCDYLATQYCHQLGFPPGKLTAFYVNYESSE